eukprot:3933766-Rhodomonas_salina.1
MAALGGLAEQEPDQQSAPRGSKQPRVPAPGMSDAFAMRSWCDLLICSSGGVCREEYTCLYHMRLYGTRSE